MDLRFHSVFFQQHMGANGWQVPAALPWGKHAYCALYGRLRSWKLVGTLGQKMELLSLQGIELNYSVVQPVAQSLYQLRTLFSLDK